jgi:hypothetical protein
MAGLTNSASQTALDAVFTGSGQYIAYATGSAGSYTETSAVARTNVTWASATSADPSVKANSGALTSAAATGAATITAFAVFSAATAGTQLTDWTALTSSRTLAIGDQVTWAAGALQITLT